MRKIETKIQINAPLERVWSIFSNFEQYSAWNPFLVEVQGALIEGKTVTIKVALSNGKIRIANPKVEKVIYGKEVTFLAKNGFLFTGQHYFIFEPVSPSETQVTHGEIFSGILPFFLWHRLEDVFTTSFEKMNSALKIRSESN